MRFYSILFYFILFYSILFFVIAKVLNTQVERHIESTYTFRRQTARSSDSSLAQCLVIESAEADERIRFFMQFNPKSFEEISTRYLSSSSSSSSTSSTSSFFFFLFFYLKRNVTFTLVFSCHLFYIGFFRKLFFDFFKKIKVAYIWHVNLFVFSKKNPCRD